MACLAQGNSHRDDLEVTRDRTEETEGGGFSIIILRRLVLMFMLMGKFWK